MSLGTIRPNLYKGNAEDIKDSIMRESNLNISKSALFIFSFLVVSSFLVSGAFAAVLVNLNDTTGNRIVSGTQATVTLAFNITNQPSASNAIYMVNITNATDVTGTYHGYRITGANSCTIGTNAVNCTGLASGGLASNISAGGSAQINLTVVTPPTGTKGAANWTVQVTDTDGTSVGTTTNHYVYSMNLNNGDIGFDIRDELGNVSTGATIEVYNAGGGLTWDAWPENVQTDNAGGTGAVNGADDFSDGLLFFGAGQNFTAGGTGSFNYNVTKDGFVNRTTTGATFDNAAANGYKPTGQLYGIKITVQDELGNPLSGFTVNVTDLPLIYGTISDNSTSTPNATLGNAQYFALPTRFDNVSFVVTRAGFLDNSTFNNNTSPTWSLNKSGPQTVGNGTYVMFYVLKVTVQDELGTGLLASQPTFFINQTIKTAPNQTSSNVAYFSINPLGSLGPDPARGLNISANRTGYINTTATNITLNTTTQALATLQLPFTLKVIARDERSSAAAAIFNSGVTIRLNSSDSTANSTSTNNYYYNISDVVVNVSVYKAGYINSTNNTQVLLNGTTQAVVVTGLNYSVRVTEVCNELEVGAATHCFPMDGTQALFTLPGWTGLNVTYSGGDAYLNATTGSWVVNASVPGFVNKTVTVTTNNSAQARVVFNTTDITAISYRGDALPFTFKVLSIYHELGTRNFTLNTSVQDAPTNLGQAAYFRAGVDVHEQNNNVFYGNLPNSTYAYINATGTSAVTLVAVIANQTFVNRTVAVTPDTTTQQTVLFNGTGINTTDNGGLIARITAGGVKYILNLTVQDELSTLINMNSGVQVTFNNTVLAADTNAASGSGQSYYFTNGTGIGVIPGYVYINVSRPGYINSTAGGATTSIAVNATNGTSRTFTLSFNLKVAAVDEISNAFTASQVNFSINNTNAPAVPSGNSPNTTSGVYAYFALTPNEAASAGSNNGYFINSSVVGYVSNSTNSTNSPLIFVNSTAQALRNVTLYYTIKVPAFGICDQLNVTCFTINGNLDSDGAGGVEATLKGLNNWTTYNSGVAYINATNGTSVTLRVFARGYVNTTVTVITNTTNQTIVVFNTSASDPAAALSYHVNASALNFSVRVRSICDQLNYTCFTINGSNLAVGAAGINISGAYFSASVNTTRYDNTNKIAYLAVPGSSAANLVAFSPGYINSTQSITPTPASAQVDAAWNSTIYGLNYSVRITAQNELGNSSNMDSAVALSRNMSGGGATSTELIENKTFFRSSLTSNVYYVNATTNSVSETGGANITVKRDGYINTSTANFPLNTSAQATYTLQMPFSVKITTTDHLGNSYTGATVQLRDGGNNIFTVNDGNATVDVIFHSIAGTNTSGSLGDHNGVDGTFYLPFNQSNITNNVVVTIIANRNGYSDSPWTGQSLGYATQLSITSANSRDTTIPVAASSVTATIQNTDTREVRITWTASTSSNVPSYRVYRNTTLVGTSTTTSYTDYPNAGIFIYNVTAVHNNGNLAATNGTASAITLGELTAPTITITSPASGANFTSQTPTISFTVEDNAGGVGVNITSIAVNISGSPAFDSTGNCTTSNDAMKYTCSYTAASLTDAVNHTISIAAKDKFGNIATNATRNFGVNTLAGVTATLNTSDTSAVADNTYANGWSFTFNITLGSTTTNSTSVNATAVRVANWTRVGGTETITTAGNTYMSYRMSNGTAATYYVSQNYNTTDTIYPLQDLDLQSQAINGTVTIYVKIPASTTPGTYTTTFTFGSWSVGLAAGGNPT